MYSIYLARIANLLTAILCVLPACSAKSTSSANQSPLGKAEPVLARPPKTAETAISEGPFASEIEARHLLNRLFREQGFRIINDVEFWEDSIEVTLDGYDPQRKIGYEYVDQREIDLDLNSDETRSLRASSALFISPPASLRTLEDRANRFLSKQIPIQVQPNKK